MISKENKIIAITGPSGAGKTTLGLNLNRYHHIPIPTHCTTRRQRKDDIENFYNYLSHEDYNTLLIEGKFLLTSGDGPIVKKEYGNFYGVLVDDCLKAWEKNNTIILFVSYKDIHQIKYLKNQGLNIEIINLTFKNIERGVSKRLNECVERNQTKEDIENRIRIANEDEKIYGSIINKYASLTIYTDESDMFETYQKVCEYLQLANHLKNDKFPKKVRKR